MLCSLTDLKTLLNITDSTQDAKLTLMIKEASAQIEGFLGYKLGRGTYTEELHNVNNRQLIDLDHFPIQSVTQCIIGNESVTDYKILPDYARWGGLYRGSGWTGHFYTRGFTHDVVSGEWSVKVTYIAGYYLPDETGYVEGADDSLPFDISATCLSIVKERYALDQMGATGLKSHSEGHISDSYSDDASNSGLSDSAKKALSRYVWYGVA